MRQVMLGTLSLGEMLALNQLAVLFLSPLSSLVYSAQKLQLARAHLDRLADVLEAEPEPVGETALCSGNLQGQIELQNVTFRYHTDAPTVLCDISLTIWPGQKGGNCRAQRIG
jgi:ABC-type bacteriocin/lantibiotic exporter with double-glycine peptidase domain